MEHSRRPPVQGPPRARAPLRDAIASMFPDLGLIKGLRLIFIIFYIYFNRRLKPRRSEMLKRLLDKIMKTPNIKSVKDSPYLDYANQIQADNASKDAAERNEMAASLALDDAIRAVKSRHAHAILSGVYSIPQLKNSKIELNFGGTAISFQSKRSGYYNLKVDDNGGLYNETGSSWDQYGDTIIHSRNVDESVKWIIKMLI